jgi:Sulfotransferase family
MSHVSKGGAVSVSARTAVRVLYVGGVPRSGSTLSDLVLDQLPGHVAVGELYYLFRNGVRLNSLCGCGQVFSECPFWTEVGQRAVGGWTAFDVEHALRLQSRVDRSSAIPWLLAPRRPAAYEADLQEYGDLLHRIYAAILEVSGAQVVVDSSKRPSLAYILRRLPGIDLTCVQVVRDPRGVAYSFSKVVPLAASVDAGETMPRSTPRKVGRRWVTVNAMIRALRRLGVPSLVVRYEDLARDPRRELQRVARQQGLEETDLADGFLTDEGLRVSRAHLVAGGRIRLVDGVLPIRLDEEWRRSMVPSSRRLVSAMTVASRRRYGYGA